jgi:beta-lactamase regulating signal transducer with metallopeptidase domain
MRLLLTLLLGFMLLGFNSQAFSCEHDSAAAKITSSSVHKHQVGTTAAVHKIAHIGYCCTGVGMVCCLTVPNSLIIINSHHRVSEELYFQDSNYKSYVAYTLQRPPCTRTV